MEEGLAAKAVQATSRAPAGKHRDRRPLPHVYAGPRLAATMPHCLVSLASCRCRAPSSHLGGLPTPPRQIAPGFAI
jgi:hypothetical protein